METKKSKNADLKTKRVLFYEIGLAVSLSLVLAAFQYNTPELNRMDLTGELSFTIPDELMPITRMEQPKPPELPKPEPIQKLEIVTNQTPVDPNISAFSSEGQQNIGIPVMEMPVEIPVTEPEYIYIAEIMPEFGGGMKGLIAYLNKELKYPEQARENNIQGKVFVEFVVSKTGAVEKARIVKGVDPLLDNEALRVVNNMPKWNPGVQNLKTVNVYFTLPINFSLNN